MLSKPEFEPEFYEKQVELLTGRYSKLFKKWNISWNKYKNYIYSKLKYNTYWIWIFLCGFEKFIQEQTQDKFNLRARIYHDANTRIYLMLKDEISVQTYLRSLK